MQPTVALHIQWRIVIKGGKAAVVGPKGLVSRSMCPTPAERVRGGKWTAPDVLKRPVKPKTKRKKNEKTRADRFLKEEDLGVLDRDADQELTRIKTALRTVPRQAVEKSTSKRCLPYCEKLEYGRCHLGIQNVLSDREFEAYGKER
ncbi:hypothetical protein TNCV_4540841 [Trichonephila clavipes]|nr:hypothetical protein TNCV_4540841 [Trichonephila clavipes]